MNGLQFFTRTNSRHYWNIASYHPRRSLTWLWILSFGLFQGDERRVWPLWWRYSATSQERWGFRIPYVGIVRWHRQSPMWQW